MRRNLVVMLLFNVTVSSACAQRTYTSSTSHTGIGVTQQSMTKTLGAHYDPCVLLTKDNAAKILGSQAKQFAGDPVISGGKRSQSCRYTTQTGLIEITVYEQVTEADFNAPKQSLSKGPVSKHVIQSLSGIGDQSYIAGIGGAATIYVMKGSTGFTIDMLDKSRVPPSADPNEALKIFSEDLKSLATTVVSRLQ